ncbi:TPA: helix-turn-helix domain-containing protein [Enterobacter cloacae]|uniref:AlpA family phage regulatory protein n=1 Tax=Enterobacter kobei TaxID=208224 RepID=A0A2J0PJA8_9ENTR|nr:MULTISPECIES: helix-turn-helix domain-containing protein [Enterobacter cloacae complex]MCE1547217.1 AlpA family phage regulatory protein [Enterobacter hormaechei]KPU03847.1 hypothetical protein AN697_16170 [Enterobacter cloacae subsp. cloacae]PJD65365.1 AlpA family phage regulatory protein [Enterobacter kobei]PJD74631.1 AlpA family phage regulatory protein [Enterobacter kobei]HBM2451794.1 AlpA family phage regulatory protein [Enterobacter hormaechei]
MSKMLTRAEVCARLGIHRKTLENWLKAGTFPQPAILGPRTHRWDESIINAITNPVGAAQ